MSRAIARLRARVARLHSDDPTTNKYLNEAVTALGHALTAHRTAVARQRDQLARQADGESDWAEFSCR